MPLFSLLLLGWALAQREGLGANDYLSVAALSMVIWWIGVFIMLYGAGAYRRAMFPLFFLLAMVPLPRLLLDGVVGLLRVMSAGATFALFRMCGVPVYREGFVFNLPGLSIEVARECSGIRSAVDLLVLALFFGHLLLKEWWGKVLLVLSILPIAVVKNGLRIVTLSLLAVYVDRSVLGGLAHRRGGYPFFFVGLAAMGVVIWLLRKMERRVKSPKLKKRQGTAAMLLLPY